MVTAPWARREPQESCVVGAGPARTRSRLHVEHNGECVVHGAAGKVALYGAKPPSPDVAICHIKSFNNN